MWNGYFFHNVSLSSLGQFIYLGHSGDPCPIRTNVYSQVMVLHTNGLHEVNIKFCSCTFPPLPRRVQFLRACLFPAMVDQPRACATFDLLRYSHILMLQSNILGFHVYHTLERLTDNTGTIAIKVLSHHHSIHKCTQVESQSWYKSFLTIMCQWRYLKMMKRSGHPFDPSGVGGTGPGALALDCPACPRPGINLPDDWDSVAKLIQ